jgi:hypothetical protein
LCDSSALPPAPAPSSSAAYLVETAGRRRHVSEIKVGHLFSLLPILLALHRSLVRFHPLLFLRFDHVLKLPIGYLQSNRSIITDLRFFHFFFKVWLVLGFEEIDRVALDRFQLKI